MRMIPGERVVYWLTPIPRMIVRRMVHHIWPMHTHTRVIIALLHGALCAIQRLAQTTAVLAVHSETRHIENTLIDGSITCEECTLTRPTVQSTHLRTIIVWFVSTLLSNFALAVVAAFHQIAHVGATVTMGFVTQMNILIAQVLAEIFWHIVALFAEAATSRRVVASQRFAAMSPGGCRTHIGAKACGFTGASYVMCAVTIPMIACQVVTARAGKQCLANITTKMLMFV